MMQFHDVLGKTAKVSLKRIWNPIAQTRWKVSWIWSEQAGLSFLTGNVDNTSFYASITLYQITEHIDFMLQLNKVSEPMCLYILLQWIVGLIPTDWSKSKW